MDKKPRSIQKDLDSFHNGQINIQIPYSVLYEYKLYPPVNVIINKKDINLQRYKTITQIPKKKPIEPSIEENTENSDSASVSDINSER